MVDGFVKIFDEFRNGCDEKSATITRHYCPFKGLPPATLRLSFDMDQILKQATFTRTLEVYLCLRFPDSGWRGGCVHSRL